MSTEMKFVLFQAVIILPLLSGTLLKKHFENPEMLAKKIININLVLFQPLIILWSVWGMKMQEDLIYLPLAGTALVAAGFLLGMALAPLTRLRGKKRATFIISSSLANHGFTMGSFLCYLVAGERGLSLALVFLAYFIPYTFGFIFPYARLSSTGERYSWGFLKSSLLSIQNIPLYTVFAALILNYFNTGKPDIFLPIDFLLMVSIALYYFTLGINFTFRGIVLFSREQLILLALKFIILPGTVFLILIPVELHPDIEMVIRIQSFMPAAIYSVISALLFDLEFSLSTRLFVVNTLVFVLVVLPLLIYFRESLM
jgi:predicted permease